MVFLEYEREKRKFEKAQEWFDEALNEQERLITKTMPSAIRYNKPNVQSSQDGSVLDDYLIAMEEKKVKRKIANRRKLLEDRERLLTIKEKELRKSHDKMDVIYVHWNLDGQSPESISESLHYSKSQVYRVIGGIKSAIRKDATKCEKKYDKM